MPDPRLTLIFAAKDLASKEAGKLHGALGKVGDAGNRAGLGLKNAAGHIADLGKAAAFVAGGALLALGAGILAATKAAADEQVGIVRLQTALKDNVKGFNGNTASIEKTIAAREKLGFSDDALRDSLSGLVARTKDVAKAQNLQAIAMDLARAKGIDLTTASNIVGKVYSGNTGILGRYGIAVAKGSTATQALAAIQKATAGQAEAYGNTTAGAFAAIQITAQDVVEDLGGLFLPMMQQVAFFIRDVVVPTLSNVVASIKDWIANNKPLVAQVGGTLSDVIKNVAGFLAQAIPKIVDFGSHIFDVASKIAAVVVPHIQAFIGTLTGKGGVFDSVGAVVGPIAQDLLPKLKDLAAHFFDLVGKVGDFVAVLWGNGQGPLALAVKSVATIFGWLMDRIGPFLDFIGNIVTGLGMIITKVMTLLRLTQPNVKINESLGLHDTNAGGVGGNKSGKAQGGYIPPFGVSTVGENGRAETVVTSSRGAYVIPNGGPGGSSGGHTFNFNSIFPPTPSQAREIARIVDQTLAGSLSRAARTTSPV